MSISLYGNLRNITPISVEDWEKCSKYFCCALYFRTQGKFICYFFGDNKFDKAKILIYLTYLSSLFCYISINYVIYYIYIQFLYYALEIVSVKIIEDPLPIRLQISVFYLAPELLGQCCSPLGPR